MLASIGRDVAYALRMMRRSPGFTAAAVLSLSIGLGANTTIFGILDQLVWRWLPVPAPDRLVLLESDSGIGYRRFVALHDRLTGFDAIGAIWSIDRFNLQTSPAGVIVDEVRIGLVSGDFFTTLGIAPMLGRLVSADDNRVPGAHPVAVVSFDFWERHFSGATTLAGRSVIVNDLRYDVVGVTPRGFSGEWTGKPTDLWVPFMMASQVMPEVPGGPNVFPARVLARLADTTTIAEAEAAAGPVFLQLVTDEAGGTLAPGVRERTRLSVVAGGRGYSPQREAFSQPIAILIIAAGALLLIACANLANLLLARSAARQREMAVRLAIGAGRARVARQLLTESVVLSTTGGAAALIVAAWANRALETLMASAPVSLAGQSGSLVLDLRVDWRAVVFMLGLSVVTGLVFGAAPARAAARASLSASLSAASARVVGRSRRFGPSGALVVVQVALSLLMLLGAGLLVRTLDNLRDRDLGYERQRELLVWTVPGQTGRQDVAMAELWRTVQRRLGALPGVASAAATNQSVLSGFIPEPGPGSISMRVEGEPPKVAPGGVRAFITPGFFATLGIPLIDGREFTERDNETAPRGVIVHESIARFYFGNTRAVGRIVRFPGGGSPPTEIIGVAKDFVKGSPRAATNADFSTYFSYQDFEALNRGAQTRLRIMLVTLRTTVPPLTIAARVRQELRAIDPALPVLRINTVDQQVDDVLAPDRLLANLSTFFAVAAVLLACLGLFGVVSYGVSRRTNEIGVRMAVGATERSVFAMIVGESSRLVAAGLALGFGGALASSGVLSSRLYGINAADPLTIAAAVALLVVVAGLASYLPARRASRVQPLVALRCD